MTTRGGLYKGPGGIELHGDGKPVERPSSIPSADLLSKIMLIIKTTPTLDESYMCHGEYHDFHPQDYKRMESKIADLLNAPLERLREKENG